jgi:hypothetical protein
VKADFEKLAQNIAEQIDSAHDARRSRARRIELITHHVKRAIHIGYRAGKDRHESYAQANAKASG